MLFWNRANRSPKHLARLGAIALSVTFVGAVACGSDEGDPADAPGDAAGGSMAGTPAGGASHSGRGGDGGSPTAFGGGGLGASGSAAAMGGELGSAGESWVDPPPREYPDDIDFIYEVGAGGAPPLTPEETCGAVSLGAAPIPLDTYILFDRSGSMNLPQSLPTPGTSDGEGDCEVGDSTVSRWCNSINALDRFFGSSAAAGTGVALQFFPAGDCSSSTSPFLYDCCSSGACCRGGAEAAPVVTLGDLPEARGALAEALNAARPAADRTPIEAALRGIIDFTARARRPGRQMMGLLITDGGPEGCQNSASSLARLVASHRESTGIPTYVVGTQGAAFTWLETIAIAGGAPEHTTHCAGGVRPCHFYSVGSGQPDVFIDVLHQIRRSAIACRFAMPQGEDGLIDPEEVALSFTPAGSSEKTRVNRVDSAAKCTAAGGFYYDDNEAPKNILLCPASCAGFREGDGGSVEILLGCKGS